MHQSPSRLQRRDPIRSLAARTSGRPTTAQSTLAMPPSWLTTKTWTRPRAKYLRMHDHSVAGLASFYLTPGNFDFAIKSYRERVAGRPPRSRRSAASCSRSPTRTALGAPWQQRLPSRADSVQRSCLTTAAHMMSSVTQERARSQKGCGPRPWSVDSLGLTVDVGAERGLA